MGAKTKSDRKSHRVVAKVARDYGIHALAVNVPHPTSPSQHLLLCNWGLTTQASEEGLCQWARPYGPLQGLRLMPDQSFSFVSFQSPVDALCAYRGSHGQGDQPLYLAFVDRVPDQPGLDPWDRQFWPPGLTIVPDFVSEAEEDSILGSLNWAGYAGLKHRQVQHFGFDFDYGRQTIDADRPIEASIPELWRTIMVQACERAIIDVEPDQCTVNRYEPGQGIPAHIDTHSCCDGTITSLSLQSDTVMNFSHEDQTVPIILPRRSLLVMSEEARYIWSHGIVPRANDVVPNLSHDGLTLQPRGTRVSLTFRKVLPGPCCCRFPAYCDSQKDQLVEMDDQLAQALEDTHVHSVYENIAHHFSETRHTPWPRVLEFLDTLEPGSVLMDNGCGNGKYLSYRSDLVQVGCDYSQGLAEICRGRGFEALRSNCLALPFRSCSVDGVICIAVIHHLATKDRRLRALSEMKRVLHIGGVCLIYAWAQEQAKDDQPSSYLKKSPTNPTGLVGPATALGTQLPLVLPVHKNRTNFQHQDLLVPWKTTKKPITPSPESAQPGKSTHDQETFHRYYHVFAEGELEALVSSVEGVAIQRSYYDQGNWCVVVERLT